MAAGNKNVSCRSGVRASSMFMVVGEESLVVMFPGMATAPGVMLSGLIIIIAEDDDAISSFDGAALSFTRRFLG